MRMQIRQKDLMLTTGLSELESLIDEAGIARGKEEEEEEDQGGEELQITKRESHRLAARSMSFF